jgi:nucleoside-diphosphate-sugar epimerase
VLVTGGTGFVGSHLVRRLAGEGHAVSVLARHDDDTTCARLAAVRDTITIHTADLGEPAQVARVVDAVGPQQVFHLAAAAMHAGRAPEPLEQVTTNVLGSVALMEASRALGVDAFVNVGDAFEYGPGDGRVAEQAPCRPISADGITKLAATLYGASLARALGMPVVTVRPFSVVGPGDDPRRLVPRLVETARVGGPLLLSDPRIVRDLVWVDDVIELLVRVAGAAAELRGTVLNCGSGRATTLGELVTAVERVTGSTIDARWGEFPVAEHDLHHPVADVTAATRALGWQPQTSLEEMLACLWRAGDDQESTAQDAGGAGGPPR